jgi:hypothetical protein
MHSVGLDEILSIAPAETTAAARGGFSAREGVVHPVHRSKITSTTVHPSAQPLG